MNTGSLARPAPARRAPLAHPRGSASEPGPRASARDAARCGGTVAVLVLADLRRSARAWGWLRLVLGSVPLRGVPGLVFAKVLGSGAGGGFGLAPSATHQGLFLVFDDEPAARRFVAESPTLQAYEARARELCVVLLRACSSKGSWSGATLQVSTPTPSSGPIAALTRASIRPRHAVAFWRLAPAAQSALASAPGCRLAAGLGEAPLLRQATFSLWSSAAAMDAYARSGAHQRAILTAYREHYFSESMFVRFVPLEVRGVWQGQHHG